MSGRTKDWRNYLFVGTHGHVVALNKRNGHKAWETSLPQTGYSIVSILVEDELLFCASGGRVFALSPVDGQVVWSNGLKGMGTGPVYLTTAFSNNTEEVMSVVAELQEQQRQSSTHAAH